MDHLIELTYQGIALGILIAILIFLFKSFRNRIIELLLKIPSYAKKNKDTYFNISSDEIILRSTIYPLAKKECSLKGDTFTLKPDEKNEKDRRTQIFQLSQVAKIEIIEKVHWSQGKLYNLLIWRNDTSQSGTPLEYELPDHSTPFRPIALEAALEIKRHFDEYVANNQNNK